MEYVRKVDFAAIANSGADERVNQRLFADAELIEFICNENERSSRLYDR